jgi:DNA-binding NtrC family response regulator
MNTRSALLGESDVVKKLNKQIQQLAASPRDILIEGEPGVGKTTVAHQIHLSSKDRVRPFVILGPRITSDEELKARLFPEELRKDEEIAAKQIPALVGGSTLYIRDIEDSSFLNQSRLTRFFDVRKVMPKVRVIATTKDPLQRCYEKGMLMDGLFNHLSSFERIYISPLRERPEDIPVLAQQFVADVCYELGVRIKTLDVNTLDFLAKYDWKGNAHELKAIIEKSVHHSEGPSLMLPPEILDEKLHLQGIIENIDARRKFSMDQALSNIEKLLLERMLKVFGRNQSRVAEALGITEGNLRYRLKKYSIPSSRQHS